MSPARRLDIGLETVTGALLAAMMLDVLFGVADRFILHWGAPWPGEIGRYLLAWVTLLAAASAVKREEHFAVSYFVEKHLSARARRAVRLFGHGLTFAAAAALLILGLQLVKIGALQISPGSGIPLSWVFLSMPVSAAFMMIYSVRHARRDWKAKAR